MKIRKKHLYMIGLTVLCLCTLSAIVLIIYLIFFYGKKLPQPHYASAITSNIAPQQLMEITVRSPQDGQTYTFTDEKEMQKLLENLQSVKLYREIENDIAPEENSYQITVAFADDIFVEYHLSDGYCSDSNGTMYECADTTTAFLDTFDKQISEERYNSVKQADASDEHPE